MCHVCLDLKYDVTFPSLFFGEVIYLLGKIPLFVYTSKQRFRKVGVYVAVGYCDWPVKGLRFALRFSVPFV